MTERLVSRNTVLQLFSHFLLNFCATLPVCCVSSERHGCILCAMPTLSSVHICWRSKYHASVCPANKDLLCIPFTHTHMCTCTHASHTHHTYMHRHTWEHFMGALELKHMLSIVQIRNSGDFYSPSSVDTIGTHTLSTPLTSFLPLTPCAHFPQPWPLSFQCVPSLPQSALSKREIYSFWILFCFVFCLKSSVFTSGPASSINVVASMFSLS